MSGTLNHHGSGGLRRAVRRIDRVFTLLENVLLGIACLAVVAIALVVAYSAAARYLFANPVDGSQVWVAEFFAPAAVFFALAAALRMRRHIGVTFAVAKLPVGTRLIVEGIAAAIVGTTFLVVAYQGAQRTIASFLAGHLQSGVDVPLWCAYLVVPIGATFVGIRAFIICLQWCVGERDQISLSETHRDTEFTE